MKRMILLLAAIAVIGAFVTTPADAGSYVVRSGDTLSKIAQGYEGVTWQEICQKNRLSNCDTIRVGQTLTIPGSEKESTGVVTPPQKEQSRPVDGAKASVKDWRHVGVDTVVPKSWHRGDADGRLQMTVKQRQRLINLSFTKEEVDIVGGDLAAGKCHIAFREEGHIWQGGMGFGRGFWSQPTRNATGDAVAVWECPAVNGKQVDFPKCGNPAVNLVSPPPAVVHQEGEERIPVCMLQGMEFVQGGIGTNYDGHNAVVAMELACLRKVGKRWEMGPLVHFGRGWFHEDDIVKGRSDGLHFGGRFRYTAQDGGVFKFDLALGPGSLLASDHDGEWKIEKFGGLDIWLAPQWEKCWKSGTCLEIMGYATVPITGRLGDVTGDGWVNEDGATRVWTAGLLARLSHDFGWVFIPEVTTGLMAQEDVDTLGVPLKLGVRTRDRSLRAWVGMEFWTGDTFVFGAEHNWGGKALYLGAKQRREEVENGKKVSINEKVDVFRPDPETVTLAKTEVPKARETKTATTRSTTPSPFGWIGDVQNTISDSSDIVEKPSSSERSKDNERTTDSYLGLFG
jgi:hypothetical protein